MEGINYFAYQHVQSVIIKKRKKKPNNKQTKITKKNPQNPSSLTVVHLLSTPYNYIMFQYYGHRAKLRVVDREDELETLNLRALDIAKEVADRTGRLLAGNISNTTIFNRHDPETIDEARSIFKVNSFMKYY